jgi:hypothetical protein
MLGVIKRYTNGLNGKWPAGILEKLAKPMVQINLLPAPCKWQRELI